MLDMRKICSEIDQEIPVGYHPEVIKVNLDSVTPDINQTERPKIISLFERIAKDHLHENTIVEENNSIESRYDYQIVCSSCNNKPMYDTQKEEYYCGNCNKSIFNY